LSGFRARYPSSPASTVEARRAVLAYLAHLGIDGPTVDDLESALGEALANAAEHGHRDGAMFEVHSWVDGDGVVIEVQDDGPGFPSPPPEKRPGSHAPRGFGIFIMRTLVDEVSYGDQGRRVRLRKRLRADEAHGRDAGSAEG
jgi:anti-sigma regulatory factor (Ser/Thr protein kinase)